MRAVIIENGVVINSTNTDTLVHPDGLTMVYSDTAAKGWTYSEGVLSAPIKDLYIEKSAKQTANKAACTAFILQHYPEPIQRSAALGVYPSEISAAMTDHIVDIIAEENRVFDLLEAATTIEELNAVENPTWPEV